MHTVVRTAKELKSRLTGCTVHEYEHKPMAHLTTQFHGQPLRSKKKLEILSRKNDDIALHHANTVMRRFPTAAGNVSSQSVCACLRGVVNNTGVKKRDLKEKSEGVLRGAAGRGGGGGRGGHTWVCGV